MNMLHSRESNDQATWSRLIATSHTQDGLTIADIRAKAMRSLERFQRATMQRIAVTGISLHFSDPNLPLVEFSLAARSLSRVSLSGRLSSSNVLWCSRTACSPY